MMKTLLIAVVCIGIASVVITIFVGTTTFEGTVVSDPYEAGLKWDAKQRDRRESGWNVALVTRSVSAGRNEILVSAADGQGKPLSEVSISLKLASISTNRYDREYPMERIRDGAFQAIVDIPRHGPWLVTITLVQRGRTMTFEDELQAR
jgi:nitrogen fixation protein FixH